jgi:phosphoribosylformylglycinamidine synthase
MVKIVVDVMLKPEILDPQGKAVAAALPRLGFAFAKDVRQGKRFEIEVDGEPTAAQLADVEKAAEVLFQTLSLKTSPYEWRSNRYENRRSYLSGHSR